MRTRRKRTSHAGSPPRLHALNFKLIVDDGREVTYRAYVSGETLAPVFALSVITASPHNQEQRDDLLDFLRQMRAAFQLVDHVCSVTPSSSHPSIGFNPASEILIIPELARSQKGGPPDVSFAVETTIGASGELQAGTFGSRDISGPINHRRHKFLAEGSQPIRSTVHCTGGTIIVVHPYLNHPISAPNYRNLPPESFITLRGIDDSGNRYRINGAFQSANNNN
jgi:hypothetical protein